jgi:hypothetical protein
MDDHHFGSKRKVLKKDTLRPHKPKKLKVLLSLNEQGVCHTTALPFTLKSMLRQKEELWKLKYFTVQKNIIFKKIL